MKLLIIAQVIDKHHPILGFFHGWILEFSKNCEQVHVICLQKGTYDLPANVTVHSLGKEEEKGKLSYVINFYRLIWQLRHNYDNVFVHMNQIYVILGAPVWRLLGKQVGLWYAHGAVSRSLKLAVLLTNLVFTSTKEGLRIETNKRVIVGQGIDVDKFKLPVSKEPSDVLRLVTVGRIAQSKNIETLLKACSILKQQNIEFEFKIVGSPITRDEEGYETSLIKLVESLGITDQVMWVGAVSNHDLPELLQQSDIFIHDGSTNSLDKALLEAVLCGCIVISSNEAYVSLLNDIIKESTYKQGDYSQLANIIVNSDFSKWNTERLQNFCKENFTIKNLAQNIIKKYN